ncbi:MAG: aminotransferase class I/II-fold pyridoxal phosphate-dependent enzyme, partial [Planctomycetaceae bacterium]
MTRRHLLATGAGSTMGGWLTAADGSQKSPHAAGETSNIYEALGVTPVINAAGTITTMGGSLMPPEVTAAWLAASQNFVPLLTLQDRVGERIAELLKVEAALVTTGAAGALQIGTAAALTQNHPERVAQLPNLPGGPYEVIRQVAHRECYDHQVTACGTQIVQVDTVASLEAAINERTVMMLAYNVHEPDGVIGHAEWLGIARRHGIVTLLDAAADVPPVDRLWEYNRMGYDLVAFSGGKA